MDGINVNDTAVLDAVELLAGYESGAFTPLQVLQGVTERIARRNPEVNAFAVMNPLALEAARESTLRWQAGQARALEGIPVTVSDLIDVAGLPTRQGSKTTDSSPVRRDSPIIAVLRAAGVVIIGKTNVSEFGWKYHGDSPLSGMIRNPWTHLHTPGGPSGGAAAAAASFFAPLHVAENEVCVPAAWSGVVGLKIGSRTENQGLIARSVADINLVSAVLKGAMRASESPAHVQRVKIGILRSPGFAAPASDANWAVIATAKEILAAHGVKISDIAPALSGVDKAFMALWQRRLARHVQPLSADQQALLDPALLKMATTPAYGAELDEQDCETIRQQSAQTMGRVEMDILICPTVPHNAPLVDADISDPARALVQNWAPWTMLFSLTGQPAMTLPMGIDAEGLPTSVQIAAKSDGEELLFRVAKILEQALE